MNSASLEPGGFLHLTLPFPSTSSTNSPSANSILPQPRPKPLKSGSARESIFIDYVDQNLLGISRRYEKRFNNFENQRSLKQEEWGYEEFGTLARDLEALVDVVWVSGTRLFDPRRLMYSFANYGIRALLQTPYLFTIALAVNSDLSSFSFSPLSTFQLLHKLDLAFCSLLRGVNVQTGESLPGFESGRARLSTTEKVRMRGIVERTRVIVVEVAEIDESMLESVSGTNPQTETEDGSTIVDTDDTEAIRRVHDEGGHGRWEMEIARVYERTIVELGLSLDSSRVVEFE